MSENLTAQLDNYALYLPALDPSYCEFVVGRLDEYCTVIRASQRT